MLTLLKEQLREVVQAVAPFACVALLLLVVVVNAPLAEIVHFIIGVVLVIAGMMLLFTGLELGVLPMGRFIGAELPKKGSLLLVILVAFALGFATTVAEPDVLVLAGQVDRASQGAIKEYAVLYVIAFGLAIFVAIAMARVVFGFPMPYLLGAAYLAMLVLSYFAPAEYVALAYDAGSATTGVLTAPVVIAVALGLSSVLAGRSAVTDGFGLLGFASIGPIIALLLMGLLWAMNGALLLEGLGETAASVLVAVLPLAALFIAFQVGLLRLPGRDFRNILTGTLLSAAGLFLFLLGVSIGFLPAGQSIGAALGGLQDKWLLVPAGVLLGFVTTWGEPAVRILADQVEDASNGSIPRSLVLNAVCIGVAAWVGLGMLRIVYGIPILYLLVPGYLFVIAIMWLSDRDFVGIAVDAGGVATGPLANTFLLALALGASAGMGSQDPLVHGLGLISLIAIAPVISLMALGLVIRWKGRQKE